MSTPSQVPMDDAERMRLLRVAGEDWKRRAQAEAHAGAKWRLLAAALLARVPGRVAEFTIADLGSLRSEGLSIDWYEAPDGTHIVRLHKPEDEQPPKPAEAPAPEPQGTPCGTRWPPEAGS